MTAPIDGSATLTTSSARTALDALVEEIAADLPEVGIRPASAETAAYAVDAATRTRVVERGPAVAFPTTAGEVQSLVRAAARQGVSVVARGAGTGLAGGATATDAQLVVSTERLTRIIEVSPLDEVAVVEPGVLNIDLNRHLEQFGVFYAPDPASWDVSTIGGNVATNAGGLRCAKYGVTRESVLALDVVLADGSLIRTGHRSIKGVTGLDLVSLLVGSEGILGIVVAVTVRIRPIPVERRTVSVEFPTTEAGARALGAISLSPVRPSILEFLDAPTLVGIDRFSGTDLSHHGGSLLLIELDGYGVDQQLADLERVLTALGGRVRSHDETDGARLWELRRSGRGFAEDVRFVGADIAVPKSRIVELFAELPLLAERYGVEASAVAHAGDGNLHPALVRRLAAGDDPAVHDAVLHDALDELTRFALALGGTVSGEHGVGSLKRELAAEELGARSLALQHAVKHAFDPHHTLNPDTAI